jgi:hypothetical protein
LFLLALSLKNLPAFLLGILMLASGILVCSIPGFWLKRVLKQPKEHLLHHQLSD